MGAVTLGGLTVGSTTDMYVDPSGVMWVVSQLKGWGLSAPRQQITAKPQTDGSYLGPGTRAEMAVSLGLYVCAPDAARLRSAEESLAAAVNQLGTTIPLTVDDGIDVRTAYVRTSDTPEKETFGPYTGPFAMTAQYNLVAPDAVLYGAEQSLTLSSTSVIATGGYPGGYLEGYGGPSSSHGRPWPFSYPYSWGAMTGGQSTVVGGGNYRTFPVLRFDGPLTTPWVGVGEDRLTLDLDIGAGEFVVADCATRDVLLDGTADRAYAKSGAWLVLNPGANALSFGAGSGTGSVTVTWRPTWAL